jgi:hypothetical protein
MFFHGHGFAGQRRLADEEVLRADQADIRRNNRASLEDNNVSWHDFRHLNVTFLAIAEDQASGFHHCVKLFDGLAGTVLLHMREHHTQHNHTPDNGRRANISHQERDRADHEELDDQWVFAPLQDFHDNACLFRLTEDIGPYWRSASSTASAERPFSPTPSRRNASSLTGWQSSTNRCSCSEMLVSAAFAALRKTLGWIFPKSSRNIPSGP